MVHCRGDGEKHNPLRTRVEQRPLGSCEEGEQRIESRVELRADYGME
jgi:hypothetical protein